MVDMLDGMFLEDPTVSAYQNYEKFVRFKRSKNVNFENVVVPGSNKR